jgi:hypothetical protein
MAVLEHGLTRHCKKGDDTAPASLQRIQPFADLRQISAGLPRNSPPILGTGAVVILAETNNEGALEEPSQVRRQQEADHCLVVMSWFKR